MCDAVLHNHQLSSHISHNLLLMCDDMVLVRREKNKALKRELKAIKASMNQDGQTGGSAHHGEQTLDV